MRRELVSLHWFPSPFLPTLSDPPSERQDRLQRMERNSPFFPIFISSPFHVSLLYPPPVFPLFRRQTHIYKKPLLCCCSSDLPANHHPTLSRIVTFYTTNEFSFFFFLLPYPALVSSALVCALRGLYQNETNLFVSTLHLQILYVQQSLTWLRAPRPN